MELRALVVRKPDSLGSERHNRYQQPTSSTFLLLPMSDLPTAQRHALEAWATDAIHAGWLNDSALRSLDDAVTAAPAQLFNPGDRPLVVGLFGGTGVGKSTLLNRLANEPVARASAERPTSRSVTVYVHRSISVDNLPENFPMHKIRTALHNNEYYRQVMFIDMPDYDSVETTNRDLVDLWLPHLDVVLYVVSPDRYRDDQGWRLLLAHAGQHAWIFIMNHWDRGEPEQLEDFRQQLGAAGLQNPVLFRSDSSARTTSQSDDFAQLEAMLKEIADRSIITALDELGVVARLKAMKTKSEPWLDSLGSEQTMSSLISLWNTYWKTATQTILESSSHKALVKANEFAEQEGSWTARFRGQGSPASTGDLSLIDESFLSRIDNLLADFLNQQSLTLHVPLAAIKFSITENYARSRRDFAMTVQDALDRSMAKPGSSAQRALHKFLGALTVILPLASMGWITWRVVNAFIQGGTDPAAYLPSSFAINGALLLGLSWLIPAFLQRKAQPSRAQAALRGINSGLEAALYKLGAEVSHGLDSLESSSQALRQRYQQLWLTLATPDTGALPEHVQRMLASKINQTTQRSLDVRANTHSSTDDAPVS